VEITPADLPESIRNLPSSADGAAQRTNASWSTRAATTGAPAGSSPTESRATTPLPEVWLRKPLRQARQAMLEEFEHNYLQSLLTETGGKIGETAKRAGIETRSLFDKMKRHGLKKEDFRRAR
jgi:DNA-binding NtrC family response regulator